MRILDLFAGIGGERRRNTIEKLGHEYITMDFDKKFKTDIVCDIFDFDINLFGNFDFIWASPPCESFSVASIGHHWHKGGIPKTNEAIYAKKLLKRTLDVIKESNTKNWLIENPVGMMRKMDEIFMVPRYTVTYCQYGEKRMKPTDLFGYAYNWTPKKMCKRGDACHESAPRGSKTGTQGIKGYAERSVVPVNLWLEILQSLRE